MTLITDPSKCPEEWTEDGITYAECACQPYTNMVISAGKILDGAVPGHERNTCYLRIESATEAETFVLLTDDELAAVAYCTGGVLWSRLMDMREGTNDAPSAQS